MSGFSLELISVSASLISAMGTFIIAAVAWFYLTTALKNKSQSRYNEDLKRAELSEMRQSYERKIADIASQLTATEARWKDVNHLLLSSQNAQPATANLGRAPYTLFLKSLGLQPADLEVDPSLIFMLTPFSDEYRNTYERVVAICSGVGMKCERGDEEMSRGDILSHVLRRMLKARIVIANVGGRNANVFFELGIAQAMDKSTILISKSGEGVPFDIQNFRILIFDREENLDRGLLPMLVQVLRQ